MAQVQSLRQLLIIHSPFFQVKIVYVDRMIDPSYPELLKSSRTKRKWAVLCLWGWWDWILYISYIYIYICRNIAPVLIWSIKLKKMVYMKIELTIFASLNTSRDSKPDTADRENHLVPKLHQPLFYNLHFLSAFLSLILKPSTHSNCYAP